MHAVSYQKGTDAVLIEVAFACVITFAVALAQATRRSILRSGSIIGPVQAVAAIVCAALVPALLVYSVHFHTSWTLGIDSQHRLASVVTRFGFELALVSALGLFVAAASAYIHVARRILSGKKLAWLAPSVVAMSLALLVVVRGSVGDRFAGGAPPPVLVATGISLVLLVAAVIAAHRFDLDEEY